MAIADDPAWREVAAPFNSAWNGIDRDQLPRIQSWSKQYLPTRQREVRYLFSGPDFIYAAALFPDAATYIFTGLEPVGGIPDLAALPTAVRRHAIECVRAPFGHFQNYGVFLTAELEAADKTCEFKGNLPRLFVALAHAQKSIRAVDFVGIERDGVMVGDGPHGGGDTIAGVRITFADSDHGLHLLYYFNTDLSDAAVVNDGFLRFGEQIGHGVTILKAASYLLHSANFSLMRQYILRRSAIIVEDDSGVPLNHFDPREWRLRPFGHYLTPVKPFQNYDQPELRALYQVDHPGPLPFGFGYRWRADKANLLLAVRKTSPPSK